MFRYNSFWHFWFTLDNRHYRRSVLTAITAALIISYIYFPFLVASYLGVTLTMLLPSLVVGAIIMVFNKLSDFFYAKQQTSLRNMKQDNPDHTQKQLNEQIDYYLDRRVVCPQRLLTGQLLEFASTRRTTKPPQFKAPPHLSKDSDTMSVSPIQTTGVANRNQGYKATTSGDHAFFIKTAKARHALSEVAAGEMAAITGFGECVPSSSVADHNGFLKEIPTSHVARVEAKQFLPNSETYRNALQGKLVRRETEGGPTFIYNDGVERLVFKFISLLKELLYKAKLERDSNLKLSYVQTFVPGVTTGLQWYMMFTPQIQQTRDQAAFIRALEAFRVPDRAKALIREIDVHSFQENFLLHLVLGSKDCNPGNTLFSRQKNGRVRVYSIDHEDIMPEDNYNITKQIPMIYDGSRPNQPTNQEVANVFPMRIWLAGLPQADIPFSRDIMLYTLKSLDPNRVLAFHRHKKLFSAKAVGAQLDRINLIRDLFTAELAKPEPKLTPKALFLQFINNHPTYEWLKRTTPEFCLFILLGNVPTDAQMDLSLHPLQFLPMVVLLGKLINGQQTGNSKPLTDEEIATPYAARAAAYTQVASQQGIFAHCKNPATVMKELSAELVSSSTPPTMEEQSSERVGYITPR